MIATHIGTYVGYVNKNKITLKNVLYIPVLKRSLMSIHNLTKDRYKTVFYRYNNINLASVYGPERNKLFTTSSNSSWIYKIWTFKNMLRFNKNRKGNNIKCDNTILSLKYWKLWLWNRRLGHFNNDNTKDSLNKINIKCGCKIRTSKMRNGSYPNSDNKSKEPLNNHFKRYFILFFAEVT